MPLLTRPNVRAGREGRRFGIPVVLSEGRVDARQEVLDKISGALELLEKHMPAWFSRMRRDIREIAVSGMMEEGEIGRWDEASRICMIDCRHASNDEPESIAATIVHEATHARLLRAGIGYGERIRRRVEMVCTRAMLRFLGRLPATVLRDRIIAEQRAIMSLPWGHWSDEARALSLVRTGSGLAIVRERRLMEEEIKAGKRRRLDAGHRAGIRVKAWIESRSLGTLDLATCTVELLNKCGVTMKIVWGGWMVISDGGEWQEVCTSERRRYEGEAPPGGRMRWVGEEVPMEGIIRGAMWCCVGIDPSGNTHYGEYILNRSGHPQRGRIIAGAEYGEAGAGETNAVTGGISVGHHQLLFHEISGIDGGITLAGRIRKDYSATSFYPYSTEIRNESDEPFRIAWMQSYEVDNERGWRGRNITGRVLGPGDFLRWFGGHGVDDNAWMDPGSVARCDLNWNCGAGGVVRWACLAVGRSNRTYQGEGGILLNRPLCLEALSHPQGNGAGD